MKRLYPLIGLFLIMAALIPSLVKCEGSTPQRVFADNFEAFNDGRIRPPKFTGWKGGSGADYRIETENGNKVLKCTPESGEASYIFGGNKDLTDYTISVRVKPGTGEGRSMRAGLVARCLDNTTWYQYMIRGNQGKLYLLSRTKGNPEKTVAPEIAIPNFDPNKYYKLTLKVSGSDPVQLTAYLDDEIQFGGTQTPSDIIKNGFFGLYSYSAEYNPPQIAPSHYFDEVEVTQP